MNFRTNTLIAMATVAAAIAGAIPAAQSTSADVVTGEPFLSHTYAGSESYDYNPSIIQDGNIQRFWWCGGGANPHQGGYVADNIYYAKRDTTTGSFLQSPISVFNEGPPGSWDDYLDCNPSVIAGDFAPFGDGVHYSLAMYYVAVGFDSPTNQIGVAFSNDGIQWRRWATPVIPRVNGTGQECYGVGSPSSYNINGAGQVRLFYHDACAGQFAVYSATSTDGVHFGPPTQVNQSNLGVCSDTGGGGIPTTANFAFDPVNQVWYAVMDLGCSNGQRANERGTIGFRLFRAQAAPTAPLANTAWQEILTVDTNATGYEINSWPALARDQFGNVSLPNLTIFYSVSNPRPAPNTTVAAAAASADPSHWDISFSTWISTQRHVTSLRRFQGTTHNVTTGYVDRSVFPVDEGSLGYLYESPQPSTVALYNCQQPGTYDYFVSSDPLCEGQRIVGLQGYALTSGGSDRYPLYRCAAGAAGGHFVSHDPGCEGQSTEVLLGYALAN